MLGAEDDAAPLPQPEPVAVARFSRTLVAAMVVLASAGMGYVGSRLWPLSAFSSPAMHRPAVGDTGSVVPVSREGAPPSTRASRSAVIPDPIIPFDLPSPLQPSAVVSVQQKARTEVRSASTGTPDSSVSTLYRAPVGLTEADGRSVPKTGAGASKDDRSAAVRRKLESTKARRSAGGQGAGAAKSSAVEFAPNPRPNQAVRDYMGYPSSN